MAARAKTKPKKKCKSPVYRKFYTRAWSDEKVFKMSLEQKAIFFYCLTSDQTSAFGMYVLSHGKAAEELGMLPETFRDGFDHVSRTLGWGYDEQTRVLYIPSWWKHNPPPNRNVLIHNLERIGDIPQTPLLQAFATNTAFLAQDLRETFTVTLRKRLGNGSGNQEQDQEQEKSNTPLPPLPDEQPQGEESQTAYQQQVEQLDQDIARPARGFKHDPRNKFSCVPVPPSLKTPEFETWWLEWHVMRADAGEPVVQLQARELLSRMEPWGAERAVAAIRYSIGGRYKQIVEDRSGGRPGSTKPSTLDQKKARLEELRGATE
jgi:hypothetical protein